MMAYRQITQPTVMGVVNVTPDSFSDGGRFSTTSGIDHHASIEQAIELCRQGAGIIDVGGEASSFHRPGVAPVAAEQQIHRVVPVINGLQKRRHELSEFSRDTIMSIDTRCSQVAEAAISAGAQMVNDISAGEHDPAMFRVVMESGCFIVLMHLWVESPGPAPAPVPHDNICGEVFGYLRQRANAAMAAGIARDRILLDPGIGFGKAAQDNWRLIAGIGELVSLGFPVVLGASRKRFLSDVTAGSAPDTWDQRDLATALVTALATQRGVLVHRVHNVRAAVMALAVSAQLPATST